MMTIAEPTTRRWTREEYYRMGDMGWFDGQRVELIDGEIIEMAPQRDLHAACVGLASQTLTRVFGPGYWVRSQLPLSLGVHSEPEPDVSVVRGSPRDFIGAGHPQQPALVVEVSDTTLKFDRTTKASLYAAFGIDDYWIVNVVDRVVEVHRRPTADPSGKRRGQYQLITTLHAGDVIAPLAAPQQAITVADLLP